MEMTTVKTIGVLSIIFGCFAVLYPKIFHPMLMHALGSEKPSINDPVENRAPPFRQGMGQGRPINHPGGGDDAHKHMRPGPHPGMRAAAEMKKQAAATQGGSGKGMMSVVLPMYAVGIVIYLIYTMTKVFGKRDKKAGDDYLSSHFADVRYDADRQRFVSGKRGDDDDDDMSGRGKKKPQNDLEKLLFKADRNKINESEVEELKRRLMETEAQMSRLLAAMGNVSQQVEATAASVAAEAGEEADEEEDAGNMTGDSEHTESYEMVSGPASPDADFVKDFPQDSTDDNDHITTGYNQPQPIVEDIKTSHHMSDEENADSASDDEDEEEYVDDDEEEEDVVLDDDDHDDDESTAHPDLRKRLHKPSDN